MPNKFCIFSPYFLELGIMTHNHYQMMQFIQTYKNINVQQLLEPLACELFVLLGERINMDVHVNSQRLM